MDIWTMIILEIENVWRESVECKNLPDTIDFFTYEKIRDVYKAKYIYNKYGFKYFEKFVKKFPHIIDLLDNYVPCKIEEQKGQCSMFCHKYNYGKGCILCQ